MTKFELEMAIKRQQEKLLITAIFGGSYKSEKFIMDRMKEQLKYEFENEY